jgi:bis(5'-nucleosyl)-tetraphosphatase (symmetrical)
VHAGLSPQWDLPLAQRCAAELEAVLRGNTHRSYFQHMYGDQPDRWSEELAGWDRLRYITNAFTRLRYCDAQGRLDMRSKGAPGSQPEGWLPWFEVPGRKNADLKIVFGHWSMLGMRRKSGLIALDSGCVWGGRLTAVRLDSDDLPMETIECTDAAMPSY